MPTVSRGASIRLNVEQEDAKAKLAELEQRGAQALNAVGAAAERQTPRMAALGRAVDMLGRTYDPLGSAVQKIGRDQELLNRAHAAGRVDAEQYARISAGLAAEQVRVSAAMNGTATAARFTHTQMAILQAGGINTVQSIAAGLPVYQTLTTQLFQTAPAFAGMAASAIRVGGPLIALGAAALVVGGRIAGINSEAKQVDEVLRRLNPTLDQSAEKLRKLSFDVAEQSGVGRGDAMSGITALASIRDLPKGVLEPLAKLVPDLAVVLKSDLAPAAEAVGKAFVNGSASLIEYGKQTGLLTAEQQKQIKALDDQGKRAEAYSYTLTALQSRVGGASAAMQTDFSRAAGQMGRAWDDFVEKVSRTGWVRAAMAGIASFTSQALSGLAWLAQGAPSANAQAIAMRGGNADVPRLNSEIVGAEKDIQELRGYGLPDSDPQIAALLKIVQDRQTQLDRAIAAAQAEADKATRAAAAKAAAATGNGGRTDDQQAFLDRETAAYDRRLAALKGNQQQVAVNMAGEQAYSAARQAGLTHEDALILAGKARTEALRQQAMSQGDANKAELQAIEVRRLTLAGTEAVAAAYAVSAEAVVRAEAQKQAAVEAAGNSRIDVDRRTQEILAQGAASAVVAAAASADAAEREAAGREAVARAAGISVQAEREAAAVVAAETATRDALNRALAESANARTKEAKASADAHVAQVLEDRERIRQANLRSAGAGDATALAKTNQQREDELRLLQQQEALIGQRPAVIARETAELQERLRIQRSGTEEEKAHADALAASAGKIAEMRSEMAEFERVSSRTTDQITDGIVNAFDEGASAAKNFGNIVLTVFKQIVANSVIRPIIAPIVTQAMGSIAGTGGTAAGAGSSSLGSLGMLGSLGSGANSLFSGNGLLSASSLNSVGASLGFASSPLLSVAPGSAGASMLAAEAAAIGETASLSAVAPGSLFGATTLSSAIPQVAGALALWQAGQTLAHSLGLGSGDQTKDNIFSAVFGSFGGTALASLFKKKKSVGPGGVSEFVNTGSGLEWLRNFQDNGYDPAAAQGLGSDVAKTFDAFIKEIGGTGFTSTTGGSLGFRIGNVAGISGISSQVVPDGRLTEGLATSTDTNEAVAMLMQNLLKQIDVQGLSDEVNAAIRKSASIRDNIGDVATDIAFAKSLYETNPLNPEKLTALEEALKSLGERFDEYKKKAEELGIATSLVTSKYDEAVAALKQGFAKSIDDQILALRDPSAYALQQFEESFADIRKQAELAGVDLVKIEQLYALQRAEVLKQASGGVLDQLRDYALSLRTGALSPLAPQDQYAGLKAAFEATAAQALGGDVTAQGNLQGAAQAFLEASQAFNASSGAFVTDWTRVTGIIDQITGSAPAGFTSLAAAAQATNDNLAAMAMIQDESLSYTRDMRDDTRSLLDEVRALRQTVASQAADIAAMALKARAS